MIEVNLIPDVKQELIQARRMRATVVSISILAMIVSGVVVALLASYVFGAQTLRGSLLDKSIKSNFAELSGFDDLPKMLTVQNQLEKVSTTHADKKISSRLFDMLSVIVPAAPNDVALTTVKMDTEEGTMTIEGQSPAGFIAYEAFKKTIEATELHYYQKGNDKDLIKTSLGTDIVDGERSYGEDQDGRRVLRFSLSFTYDEALFDSESQRMIVQGPQRRNATDSAVAVPETLFTAPANDEKAE